MENKKNILLYPFAILLAACLLTACGKWGPHEVLFQEVETIVNERPDSALALLETIERPETLPEREWNWRALLWTQARDKLFIRHTSDTLINRVAAYYDKHGDNHQKALAYYYKGRVNNDLGKLEEATTAYLTAYDYVKETDDSDLAFRILTQMGTLYARQGSDRQALTAYEEGLKIAIKANDSVNIAYAHAYLGRIYGLDKNWKDCNTSYKHSIAISKAIGDIDLLLLGTQELAAYYTDQDSLDTALDLLKKAVAFENEYNIPHDLSTDLAIGDIYRKLNETDSAYNYLSQAIKSENIYTKRSAYHALYYLFLQKGEAKEAIHFNEKYKACLREIKEMGSSSEIQQAKEQFELGKRIQEKEKNKTERGVIVLLFLSILSYVLWIWNIRKEQEKEKLEIRDQQREETLRDVLHENKNLKESLGTSKKETKQWKTKYKAKENEMQRDLEAYGEEMEDQLLELPLKTAQLLEELNLKPRALTDREILMIQSCVQCYHPNCWSYLQKCANLQKDDLLVCCLIRLGFTDTEKMLLLFPNPKDDNSGDMYSNEKYTKAALDKRIYRIRRERLGKILNSYKELVLFLQGL